MIPTISCISLPLLLQHVFKEEMLCTPKSCAALPSKRGRLRGAFANVFEIEWKKTALSMPGIRKKWCSFV